MAEPYLSHYADFFYMHQNNVVKTEYGRGYVGLFRGYYHPCPVEDLIVGGVQRPRLYTPRKNSKSPDFIHGFNRDNQLVTTECFIGKNTEYYLRETILYDGFQTPGIQYRGTKNGEHEDQLSCISECIYNETHQLLSFINIVYHLGEFFELIVREHSYDKMGLTTISYANYLLNGCAGHQIYRFEHDQDGCLTQFQVVFSNGTYSKPGQKIYPITKRRKV